VNTSPAGAEQQDIPRLKPKKEEPAAQADFLPRVPLSDYSAGFETETARVKTQSISPNGMQSLDAHKADPIAPFVGFSLKRPLN
jgi:hypothetical protein